MPYERSERDIANLARVIKKVQETFPELDIEVSRIGEQGKTYYTLTIPQNMIIPFSRDELKKLGLQEPKEVVERIETVPRIHVVLAIPRSLQDRLFAEAQKKLKDRFDGSFEEALRCHIGGQGSMPIDAPNPHIDYRPENQRLKLEFGADPILDRFHISAQSLMECEFTIDRKSFAGLYDVTLRPKPRMIGRGMAYEDNHLIDKGIIKNLLKLDPKEAISVNDYYREEHKVVFAVPTEALDRAVARGSGERRV